MKIKISKAVMSVETKCILFFSLFNLFWVKISGMFKNERSIHVYFSRYFPALNRGFLRFSGFLSSKKWPKTLKPKWKCQLRLEGDSDFKSRIILQTWWDFSISNYYESRKIFRYFDRPNRKSWLRESKVRSERPKKLS